MAFFAEVGNIPVNLSYKSSLGNEEYGCNS